METILDICRDTFIRKTFDDYLQIVGVANHHDFTTSEMITTLQNLKNLMKAKIFDKMLERNWKEEQYGDEIMGSMLATFSNEGESIGIEDSSNEMALSAPEGSNNLETLNDIQINLNLVKDEPIDEESSFLEASKALPTDGIKEEVIESGEEASTSQVGELIKCYKVNKGGHLKFDREAIKGSKKLENIYKNSKQLKRQEPKIDGEEPLTLAQKMVLYRKERLEKDRKKKPITDTVEDILAKVPRINPSSLLKIDEADNAPIVVPKVEREDSSTSSASSSSSSSNLCSIYSSFFQSTYTKSLPAKLEEMKKTDAAPPLPTNIKRVVRRTMPRKYHRGGV